MADKRQVKKTIKQLQRVKTWQLLVILLLMSFVSATFLRLNNIGMSERREAVLNTDKANDDYTLENRLFELQRFSASHMNASTGPFYLQGKYSRDYQKAADRASSKGNPNGNMSAKADAVCKPQFGPAWSLAYVQCFADELAKFPPSKDPALTITAPQKELYRHDFASPRFSLDFAGWSVVVWMGILLVIIARLVTLVVLRMLLKRRYRGI